MPFKHQLKLLNISIDGRGGRLPNGSSRKSCWGIAAESGEFLMNVFYSELCLIGGAVEENVDRLIAAGAENIELMLDGAGWNDFHLRMDDLAAMLKTRKVGYSVHVPVWDANLTSENTQLREAVLETYRQSIAFAALVDARHVVLHTGWCSDVHFSKDTARERARESMLSLVEYNKRFGLILLVENIGTTSTSLFTERQFVDFLRDFPERIGYLVDVGHAHRNGWNLETLLPALGEKLYAVHLHDNDKSSDSHAPLGEGTVDWGRLIKVISNTGRNLSLILEYNIGVEPGKLAEGKAFLETAFDSVSPAKGAKMDHRRRSSRNGGIDISMLGDEPRRRQ